MTTSLTLMIIVLVLLLIVIGCIAYGVFRVKKAAKTFAREAF